MRSEPLRSRADASAPIRCASISYWQRLHEFPGLRGCPSPTRRHVIPHALGHVGSQSIPLRSNCIHERESWTKDLRAVVASGIVQTCDERRLSGAFWEDVWNAHEPDAVDRFVADDVVIEAGGQQISGKDNIKNWVKEFLDHVNGLHVDAIETFQNEDGTRVTSLGC